MLKIGKSSKNISLDAMQQPNNISSKSGKDGHFFTLIETESWPEHTAIGKGGLRNLSWDGGEDGLPMTNKKTQQDA